jgi:hypothetical protein
VIVFIYLDAKCTMEIREVLLKFLYNMFCCMCVWIVITYVEPWLHMYVLCSSERNRTFRSVSLVQLSWIGTANLREAAPVLSPKSSGSLKSRNGSYSMARIVVGELQLVYAYKQCVIYYYCYYRINYFCEWLELLIIIPNSFIRFIFRNCNSIDIDSNVW